MERELRAERRDGTGKGAARKVRAAGRVPAILYGHGMTPAPLAVDARELYRILHTEAGGNVLIRLEIDSERQLALAREIQRDHIKGRFLHVDFLAVRRDEKITVDVPVNLVGESHGVKEGGVIEHHLWDVKVECLPGDVPESIEADVTALGIGENLRVGDLQAPRGTTILSDPDETIVSVVAPQVLPAEEEEEAAEAAEAEAEGATEEEAAQHEEG